MTLAELIAHEWKTRLSRPAALAALALFAAALVHGAMHGRLQRDTRLHAIQAHVEEVATTTASWLGEVRALQEEGSESGVAPWAGSPMDLTFATYLPPAPLADFAIGQSDLLPYLGAASLWNPDARLFSRYEIAEPASLALGAFDLGKGIIFLLPLMLIVLCFDVVSGERDAGRLGFVLAQGAHLHQLLWSRLAIRTGLVLAVTLVVAMGAALLPVEALHVSQRLPYFALWSLCMLLYAGLWIGIIALVASRNRSGEATVMSLLLAWAALNLIVPASIAAIAEAAYPSPSRLAYIAEAREVEIETELAEPNLAHRFMADHPDLLVDQDSGIPAYVRTAFLVTSSVDKATRRILAEFEAAATKRDATVASLRYASPAIIVHGLFNDIAGTSAARHHRYAAQVRAFKAGYAARSGPYIVAGKRLPAGDAARLPAFRFEGDAAGVIAQRNAAVLLFLALVTALLLALADRNARAIRGAG
jgi:ABC-2 type transport system permease protein